MLSSGSLFLYSLGWKCRNQDLFICVPSSSSSSSSSSSFLVLCGEKKNMGEEVDGFFRSVNPKGIGVNGVMSKNWMIGEDNEDFQEASTSSEYLIESSENSVGSSPSDTAEDASSSSISNSSSSGPLYELSELIVHLPIKRGLSKYYHGKSQSFTSLAKAKSLEDLAKRVASLSPTRKKMKSCKSYGGGLDGKKYYNPKAAMAKKASRRASFSSSSANKKSFLMAS